MTRQSSPHKKDYHLVDLDLIRKVDCFKIAKEWDLIVAGDDNRANGIDGRWRFTNESSSGTLQFFRCGGFTSYKSGVKFGGGAGEGKGRLVELVILFLNGHAPLGEDTNEKWLAKACQFIAERGGGQFSINWKRMARQARALADPIQENEDPYQWAKRQVALVENGTLPKDRREQAERFFEALGVPWNHWSLCMQANEERGSKWFVDDEDGNPVEVKAQKKPDGTVIVDNPDAYEIKDQLLSRVGQFCWLPAVVRLQERVATTMLKNKRTGKEFPGYGGWNNERVSQALKEDKYSGRYFVIDLDGRKERDPITREKLPALSPKNKLVLRLIAELKRAGFAPCVTVISSFKKIDGQDSRANWHLYFKSKEKVYDKESYFKWWMIVAEKINEIVASEEWSNVSPEEKREFHIDTCTKSASRMMRVPGFCKITSEYSAIVYSDDPGAFVDFRELHETRGRVVNTQGKEIHFKKDRMVTVFINKKKKNKTAIDDNCWWNHPDVEEYVRKDRLENPWKANQTATYDDVFDALPEEDGLYNITRTEKSIARECWPLEVVEDDRKGSLVLYRYHTVMGEVRYGYLPRAAASDASAAKEAARIALTNGLQLWDDQGQSWAHALCAWAIDGEDVPHSHVVSTAGWRINTNREGTTRSFVLGPRVYGEDLRSVVPEHAGGVRGDLETWKKEIKSLAKTPVLIFALGAALVGPMLEPLGEDSHGYNICGPSSTGKSLATYLAGTVYYGRPACGSWHTTAIAAQNSCAAFNGTAMVLDDLRKADPKHVHRFILSLSDGQDKMRSEKSGERNRKRKPYRMVLLSSGELTIPDHLGDRAMGGHSVRCPDIWIDKGDSTIDRLHAARVKAFCKREYGTAGMKWIEELVKWDEDRWDKVRETVAVTTQAFIDELDHDDDSEFQRVVENVALVMIAIEDAQNAGILPDFDMSAEDVCRWVLRRIKRGRSEARSPYERAWKAFVKSFQSEPGSYPFVDEVMVGKGTVRGIRKDQKYDEHTLSQKDRDTLKQIRDNIQQADPGALFEDNKEMVVWTTVHRIQSLIVNSGVSPKDFFRWACENGYAHPLGVKRQPLGKSHGRWFRLYPNRIESDQIDKIFMDNDKRRYEEHQESLKLAAEKKKLEDNA